MMNFIDGPFNSQPRRQLGGVFNNPTPPTTPASPSTNTATPPISNVVQAGRFSVGGPVGMNPTTPRPAPTSQPPNGPSRVAPTPYSYGGPTMSLLPGNPSPGPAAGPAPMPTPGPRPVFPGGELLGRIFEGGGMLGEGGGAGFGGGMRRFF